MSKIFISYRRQDSADAAGRIYDKLKRRFTRGNLFKDVDDIPPGVDFRQFLRNALDECRAMLVIIGDQWLTLTNDSGIRRLDEPDDWVRTEIELALARGDMPVIPVLVRGATMPRVLLHARGDARW